MPPERDAADRMSGLMLKALKGLPPREQDVVVRGLLRAALGRSGRVVYVDPSAEPVLSPELSHLSPTMRVGGKISIAEPLVAEMQIAGAGSRMLPVRLSPNLHDRLRRWSIDHGFAMAVVVRGLIERFLEEQRARGS